MKSDERTRVRESFGRRLQDFRLRAGLSPANLETLSGVKKGKIEKAEDGSGELDFSELALICRALHISVGKFTDYSFGLEHRSLLRNEKSLQEFLKVLRRSVSDRELPMRYLEKIVKVKAIDNNDFLLRRGDICKNIYFLESGLLRMSGEVHPDAPQPYYVLENMFFLDVQSFLKQQPGNTEIQAIAKEGAVVYYISYVEWRFISDQSEAIREKSNVLFDACVSAANGMKAVSKIAKGKDRVT